MKIPIVPNLTPKQKIEWTFGVIMLTLTLIGGGIASAVLGYVKSAANTLEQVDKDITQIKWELPLIKNTAILDKASLQLQIDQIQIRIDAVRLLGEGRTTEIAELRTEIALLRQKITP